MKKISTETDTGRNLRIHRATGSISVSELIAALATLYSHADYDPDMNSLWDLREASFSSFTQSDISLIRAMVHRHWSKKGRSRSALLIAQNDALRMTQFYEVILDASSGKEVKTFGDYDEALKWVNERAA